MTKNHHKAPWRKGTGIAAVIVNCEGEYLASVWGRTQQESNERTALMAAAPELLEACKEALPLLKHCLKLAPLALAKVVQIEDAIAKAEGGAA